MSTTFADAFYFDSLVWDWIIAVYLFLAGMSAGAVMIAIYLKRKVIEGYPASNGIIKATAILAPFRDHCRLVDFGFPPHQAVVVLEDYDLLQSDLGHVDGCGAIPSLHGGAICVDCHHLQE